MVGGKGKFYKLNHEQIFQSILTLAQKQAQQIKQKQLVYKNPTALYYKDMIYLNLLMNDSPLQQDNQVEIFIDGQDKFNALFQCIQEAKDHIHLLYYKVKNDALGTRMMNALVQKAKEGVHVKLLYDDIGSPGLTSDFFVDLKKAGGETTAFFSSKIPFVNPRINYRNHRKIVVIDGEIGFIGGFNIGKEYLGLDPGIGYWRDTHLKLTGGAVHILQAHFFLDWNISRKHPVSFEPKYYPTMYKHGDVAVQIVSSGPNLKYNHIQTAFIKMIYSAKKNVYIQTPYFIPDECLLMALKIVALSGVDVKVMTPIKSISKFLHWASYSYLGELMASGVKCYFYEKGFLHAKTIVVDSKIASVGTSNFDIRSFKLNFEINAFIYDTPTSQKLEQFFVEDLVHCREETILDYEKRSSSFKFMESIIRLFSPIM
ncbi:MULTISPECIES: cardiolipin synthase [unclassified Paenibacillus]|uniref:cardiolipin synthase n=1 Tax=unclassified Paenibacillus TaxID=185978 RepID=UPI001AE7889A|nr:MULTISPECIES: cardiolipin synthase [unclassified Paenibacillus]MBP1155377.1 cardiolipin synthase [Paenibacillus sp. PvP091]MBP1169239.1 cardiolipin synthase [Paenibacillus sp. PvR098]MBP2440266.1 cardiolipin synthase [Paenibacillus sp. PvP052]